MGRASRSWEDSPGEQPRGGAGGRGRRGRGRGSPHLSGAGDASAADRKSKVGAGEGLASSACGSALSRPSLFLLSVHRLPVHPSVCISVSLSAPPSSSPLPSLLPEPALCVLSLSPLLSLRLLCAGPPSLLVQLLLLSLWRCLSVCLSGGLCPVHVPARSVGLPPWIYLRGAVRFLL